MHCNAQMAMVAESDNKRLHGEILVLRADTDAAKVCAVYCSVAVLQLAVCCSAWQCVVVCCSVLLHCSVL